MAYFVECLDCDWRTSYDDRSVLNDMAIAHVRAWDHRVFVGYVRAHSKQWVALIKPVPENVEEELA